MLSLCIQKSTDRRRCNLDEIGLTFFKGGGACSCSSLDDKPKGDCFFTFGWGVLIGVVLELTSDSHVKIFGGGVLGLAGGQGGLPEDGPRRQYATP